MNESIASVQEDSTSSGRSVIVVGIGASAGGLEALESFLTHLPAQSGMAFVVVQHLDPSHASLMPELLARHTRMPVEAAADGTRVAPNRLYVMPPNVTLTIQGGMLKTSTPVEQISVRTHIDTFLRSLAQDQAERAVGVILSGAGSDGTLGLKAIKEHGGITMVQSPASAKYDSMPLSAIATGLVDYTLAVEEIPARLIEHAEYVEKLKRQKTSDALHGEVKTHLPRICGILHHATGHDFAGYKFNTMIRRVERRMQVRQLDSAAAYVARLEQDAQEAEQLFKDLLIGVTQFFRDPDAFEALALEVIPKILGDKGSDSRVRVWVPGCASGEEAYSIAILLAEAMARRNVAPMVQVFATDIDDEAIETARQGKYPASVIEKVTPQRRERYFVKHDDVYQVSKQIRDMCIFSLHNLVRDPPFSVLDLISCRNLLIYMDAGLQKRLIPLFHYALLPGGYLFLGPSEGLVEVALFRDVDKKQRIFQRLETAVRAPITFPLAAPAKALGEQAEVTRRSERMKLHDMGAVIERMALTYAPPCVVVNERGEVVYSAGETGLYLQQPTGAATLNLIDQARKGLRLGLRTALREALRTRETVVEKDLAVRTPLGQQFVDVIVRPMPELGESSHLLAVIFQVAARELRAREGQASAAEESAVTQLETELKTTRAELQTTVEELESANEELKSSNEELLSMNEEMQSANEELQTSKEEMQSVNEELATVNTELNRKVEQLDRAHGDLQNLIRSTEIATLFLDRELRIKRFTPAAAKVFHLIDSDAGRPITDFAPRFADRDLIREMREVLATLSTREHQAYVAETDTWYIVRVIPSRATDNNVDGVVVTLVDINTLKEAEKSLRDSEARLRLFVEHAPAAVAMFDRDMRYLAVSRRWLSDFGLGVRDIIGLSHYEVFPEIPQRWKEIHQRCLAGAVETCEEDPFPRSDGRMDWVRWEIHPWRRSDGQVGGISIFSEVITERKQAVEALRESETRYRNLFESMDEGFALCEMIYDGAGRAIDFRYLNINPAFEKLTGLASKQVLGKRVTEVIPGIEPFWIEHYAEVVHTGQSQRFSNLVGALGRHFDVYTYCPAPGRFAVIFTNVTERKKAEEQSHLHLTILQSAANAIVISGIDGTIQWVNPAFTRLTGYTAEEAIGSNHRMLNSGKQDAAFFKQMWETITAGDVWHGELINRRKDGSLYAEEMTITPVRNAAGILTHFIAIKQDVTERKQAEAELHEAAQRLKSHVENSPVAVIEFNPEMRITRWTEAAQRIFGWTAEEVLGKGMWEVPWIYEADRAKVVEEMGKLGEGRLSRNFSPNRNLRKDGTVIWCEWYNSSLHDEQGNLDSIFSLVLDVTERAKAQQALEQAKDVAETASRAKDQFLAVLSHELRNPLSPVLATAMMLRGDPRFDAETREQLEVICRNAELEARLIDDLLDVTRIERGKVELDRRPVELGTILRRAVEVCEPDIKAKGLEFSIDSPGCPFWVDADAARLQQVFWNLLKNAIKFTHPGGRVSVRCQRGENETVVTEVSDNGEGIEAAALERIFNAFEQAERSITRQFGGLGLGLTISKAMVDLHGGSIQASSAGRGQGSTFTVRLPLLPAQAADAGGEECSGEASGAAAVGSLRILLVEDHTDTARIMQKVLVAEGHKVEGAGDVATALRLAGEHSFDLVLSDLGLPDGSGIDLMRALRTKGMDLPGIAISGYGQESDMQATREAGFVAHLTKPVNLTRLKETIAKVSRAQGAEKQG